ncbi:hypothetical protein FOZG_18175 [Fusarium oxysporum Fo47]|uniref:Uncharacterized protein n=1 Tax=Fusarium oxysporum Fo47 TaxID=660027 RepID=W9JF59_FUSOX|nr:hypothetical protein FOZG_18175 [Fusarium oxysporum Fo47]
MSSYMSSVGVMTPGTTTEADTTERSFSSSGGGMDTPTQSEASEKMNESHTLTRKSNPHHNGKYLILDLSHNRALMCCGGNLRLETINLEDPQRHIPKYAQWECKERGEFRGFRNVAKGTFLGHDIWWDFYAKGYHHKGWEDFTLYHQEGGLYWIQTLDWWTQRQVSARQDGNGLLRQDHGGTLWEFVKIVGY